MNASIHTWMGGFTDTYLFSFHRTHESGNYYYLYLGVPIVELRKHNGTDFALTFATDITNSGAFHVYTTGTKDGIKYDVIGLYPTSQYVTATADTYEETLHTFLRTIQPLCLDAPLIQDIIRPIHPELFI